MPPPQPAWGRRSSWRRLVARLAVGASIVLPCQHPERWGDRCKCTPTGRLDPPVCPPGCQTTVLRATEAAWRESCPLRAQSVGCKLA